MNFTGSNNLLTLTGAAASSGVYTLIQGSILSGTSGLSLTGGAVGSQTISLGSSATVGRSIYAFGATASALQLSVNGFNLVWNGGASGTWNTTAANWQQDGAGSNITFVDDDNVAFGTAATVSVPTAVTSGSMAISNASGSVDLTGAGALAAFSLIKSGAGAATIAGNTTLAAGVTVTAGWLATSGSLAVTAGGIAVNGGSLTTGSTTTITTGGLNVGGGTYTANGAITITAGGLNVTSGSAVLNAVSTVGGGIAVTGGRVSVNGALTGTAVTVSGGTLGGSGTIAGTVAVQSGAMLAAGNSIQSLATGTATLSAGATFAYEIDSTNLGGLGTAADLLVVNGNLDLDSGNGTLLTLTDLNLTPQPFVDGTTIFAMINYSGAWNGGLFTYDDNVLADGGTFMVGSQQWMIDFDLTSSAGLDNFTGDYLPSSRFVAIMAVPEPSTYAMVLAGLACAGFSMWRRQKQAWVAPTSVISTRGEQVAITGLLPLCVFTPAPIRSHHLRDPTTNAPFCRESTPDRSADRHLPVAHCRSPSISSPAVTATGTTFCAA